MLVSDLFKVHQDKKGNGKLPRRSSELFHIKYETLNTRKIYEQVYRY